MKESLFFINVIIFFIIYFYLFYKIKLIFINKKIKKIDKNKYRLLKSKDNKKFKIEFFENEEWKEMDTINSFSVFFLFKNIQQEVNAKSMFLRFIEYYENKELEKENKELEKENKELEYEIIK